MEYLNFAIDLARRAGAVLSYYADRDKQVELKGRANLVTIADKESESVIIEAIRRQYPQHAILAEESGAVEGGDSREGKWIIDPLDGTTNFAHQYPFYCVSIAFEQAGEILCGAVFDPLRNDMYSGARGEGSFLNGRRLQVSEAPKLVDALLLTGFPYNMRDHMDAIVGHFRTFLTESQAIRRGGSAALDLCYLAIGRCDGFWELNLHPWDTAAALVIAEEAGARFSNFQGQPFSVYMREIVASNGHIHEEMIRLLAAL